MENNTNKPTESENVLKKYFEQSKSSTPPAWTVEQFLAVNEISKEDIEMYQKYLKDSNQ